MKKQPLIYKLNTIGGAVIIFLLIRTYVPPVLAKFGLNSNMTVWLSVYCLLSAAACLLPVAFIESMCDFHPYLFNKKFPKDGRYYVGAGMLFFLAAMILNRLFMGILAKFGISFKGVYMPPVGKGLQAVVYFIYAAVVPAVCEELFLRGTVLNLLRDYGDRFAVIVSAIVFTIMHCQGQNFVSIFISALILGCVYVYTDCIYVSMALHFTNNTYSFLTLYANENMNGVSAVSFSTFMICIIIVLGAISAAYLKRNHKNAIQVISHGGKSPKISVMFKSPVFVLAMLGCLAAVLQRLYGDLIIG